MISPFWSADGLTRYGLYAVQQHGRRGDGLECVHVAELGARPEVRSKTAV